MDPGHTVYIGMNAKMAITEELPWQSKKGIPPTYFDLPPLLSVAATGSAYRLNIRKCSLHPFINLRLECGETQTSYIC
jgi:hypothetical protein